MATALRKTRSRTLQVVHVAMGLDVGGLEKLLVEFARHADLQRQQLHFVSLGTRGELGEEIEGLGWPVTAMGEPTGLRPNLVLRLAALFRRCRPDVVHTHNTRALVYGGPAARLAQVPRLVHTWHGQNLLASPREALLFRLAGKLPDRIVAVSDDAAALMIREGIAAHKVKRIWNGIDAARFAYAGPCPGGPVVTVARLSPEKDVATLVRAVALAARDWPNLRLEVAGDGACLPGLRSLAEEFGVAERIRFLGQVNDVPAILARASFFALPSLTEGVSLTLLEAMARGLPVAATHVGGNPEVVDEGRTGLLVRPGDPAALAAAIVRLQRDPAEARQMGLQGRRRVEEHFDVRGMIEQYESLYRVDLAVRARRAPVGANR